NGLYEVWPSRWSYAVRGENGSRSGRTAVNTVTGRLSRVAYLHMRNTTDLPMSQHGPALSEARRLCAGLDFETQILVKHDAPALLRPALAPPRWPPRVLAMSGVTDPYQPVERRLRLTRRCLEVLAEFRNPVMVVTKSALVMRDVDVLTALARDNAAAVFLSVTALDSRFARRLEPRASQPTRRLAALDTLAQAGVPLGGEEVLERCTHTSSRRRGGGTYGRSVVTKQGRSRGQPRPGRRAKTRGITRHAGKS